MIYRFSLTYSGTETTVVQPRGWPEFKSEIKRDFNSHGAIYRFTSDVLKLGFADGRDILENAFQVDGVDAVVTLTVDKRADQYATWSNIYVGNAVMKNRELTENYFDVDFEASTIQQLIKNRLKTKVAIDTDKDLDGGTLNGSVTSYTNDLDTIRLNDIWDTELLPTESTLSESGETESDTSAAKAQLVTFGFGATKIDTLKDVNIDNTELVVSNGSYTGDGAAQHLWTPKYGGSVTTSGEITFILSQNLFHDINGDATYTYYLRFKVYRSNTLQTTINIATDTDTVVGASAPNTIKNWGSLPSPIVATWTNETFDVQAGDKVFLTIESDTSVTGGSTNSLKTTATMQASATTDTSEFIITQLKDSLEESVKGWLVHDVLDRISYILTGQEDSFYSEFFGNTENGYSEDGCGALNLITNGYQIRGIDRPLVISMEDLLNSLQAIYGIGYSFEKTYNNTYRLRVELMEYFYGEGEILDLGSPVFTDEKGTYNETIYENLNLNKAQIGYDKFSDEIGINNIFEDFLTLSEYSLPVQSIEGSYNKVSKLTASNDLIQATFEAKENVNKSWKYDSTNFVVALIREGGGFKQENDQPFENTTGLDDPQTAYNIRHAPVYMFLNHALIINSVLMGKSLDRLIQNVEAKINTDFSALFWYHASCVLGDSQMLRRGATDNIEIGNNFEGLRLFKPVRHSFTIAMTSTQLQEAINAMENNADDSTKNYGYVSYKDLSGNPQEGYLLDIKWNEATEIAEIQTLEKADNYGI